MVAKRQRICFCGAMVMVSKELQNRTTYVLGCVSIGDSRAGSPDGPVGRSNGSSPGSYTFDGQRLLGQIQVVGFGGNITVEIVDLDANLNVSLYVELPPSTFHNRGASARCVLHSIQRPSDNTRSRTLDGLAPAQTRPR